MEHTFRDERFRNKRYIHECIEIHAKICETRKLQTSRKYAIVVNDIGKYYTQPLFLRDDKVAQLREIAFAKF